MNIYANTLLFMAAFLPILSGCNTVQNVNAPRTQMTVRQARTALTESLTELKMVKLVREVKFSRQKVVFVATDDVYSPSSPEFEKTCHFSVSFSGMNNLSVENASIPLSGEGWFRIRSNEKPVSGCPDFKKESAAMMFIDAVLILKAAALAPDTEEADFAAFNASAKTWLAATPKPEMSDEARTFKALAEDAFKRKDLTAALDAYGKALNKHPMWPEGHYNAALLAGETEDYELAAHHMRRYLVLAPDAKDAPAAKDKLLLWQAKAKQ